MREQGRIHQKNITKEEGISSRESDPEPDLNKDEGLYSHHAQEKKSRPNQRIENEEIIIREHTTCCGQITFVKLPSGLQKDGSQIRKVRQQESF